MSGISVQHNPAFQTGPNERPGVSQSTQSGSRDGQRVVVSGGGGGVRSQDLEELSMSIASKRERKEVSKEGQRRLEAQGSRQIAAIQKIEAQAEKLPDFDKQAAQRLLQSLKRDPPADEQALQRRLGDFHEDISYQQLALGMAADALDGEGDNPTLLAQINRQIGQNEREFGDQIRAGFNITGAAIKAAAGDAAQVQELRGAYRQNVLSFEGVRTTFANLIKTSNQGESLDVRIKFLMDAISAELNAQGPSIEKRYLQAIREELYQLVALNSLRESIGRKIARYIKRFGDIRLRHKRRIIGRRQPSDEEERQPDEPSDWLLLAMLELAEAQHVTGKQVSEKTDALTPPDVEAEIYLLRELSEFSRNVPQKVFPSRDHRFRLVDACQQALDDAVEREEEMEE